MSLHGNTIRLLEQQFNEAHQEFHRVDSIPTYSGEALLTVQDAAQDFESAYRVLRWLRHEGRMFARRASDTLHYEWMYP